MAELLGRLGYPMQVKVYTDSTAAKAVGLRMGAGKLRSLECKTLWVQTAIKKKKMQLYKTPGKENLADLGTKAYAADTLQLLTELGYRVYMSSGDAVVGMISADDADEFKKLGGAFKLLQLLSKCMKEIEGLSLGGGRKQEKRRRKGASPQRC